MNTSRHRGEEETRPRFAFNKVFFGGEREQFHQIFFHKNWAKCLVDEPSPIRIPTLPIKLTKNTKSVHK